MNAEWWVLPRSATRFFAIFVFLSIGTASYAQEDLSKLGLEELLNTPITVASGKTNTTRESPAIVTLITAEEIENAGARDLMDVLRLAPGFDFAADVWGTVGPSIRGIYNSGKISLLVDGNEFVERLYSNVLFGNHFPVDQIQQIEIIRGPGSVLYGGTAEMAVVNIITKKAKDIQGVTGTFVNGQLAGTHARRNVNLLLGKEISSELSAHGSILLGDANRSDATYTDAFGTSYDLEHASDINSFFLNSGLQFKNLSLQWITDLYSLEERDHYDVVVPETVRDHFYSYILDAKYDYKVNDDWSITPRFNYSRQVPWYIDNRNITEQFNTFYKATADRYTASIVSSCNPVSTINLFGGTELYWDEVEFDKDSYNVKTQQNLKQDYSNVAAFLQGAWRLSFGNVTAGARYENHSQFGSTFVPRLSFTRLFERFHVKALFSRAFRAPNIEAIRFNARIKPERMRAIEFETGYKLRDNMFLTANIFDVVIDRPILYVFQNNRDNYFNFDETGSRGFEAEYRWRDEWGYLTLNYSFYTARKGSVPPYQAIDYQRNNELVNDDVFLAIPQNKIGLHSNIRLNSRLSFNPSLVHFSKRYGYESVDSNGRLVLETFDPVTLVNLFLLYKDSFSDNFDIGFGIYDLFGSDYKFVASYNSGHAPMPGPTREFLVKLMFHY